MKRLVLQVALILSLVTGSSFANKPNIDGKWKVIDATGGPVILKIPGSKSPIALPLAQLWKNATFNFNNGVVVFSVAGTKSTGTYTMDGNTLIEKHKNGYSGQATIKITGKTMTYTVTKQD